VSGGYRTPVHLVREERGLLWGTVALLLAYSLIPENLRFSRVMILAGSVWSMGVLPVSRLLFRTLHFLKFESDSKRKRRIAIAGHLPAIVRVKEVLDLASAKPEIVGYVSLSETDSGSEYLGTFDRISDIVKINRIEEIIFCAEDVRSHEIISAMLDLADSGAEIKIAPPDTLSIIGNHSIHTSGDLYHIDINAINRNFNKKIKRLFDMTVAILLLVFIWLEIWMVKNRKILVQNIRDVLLGRKSWVGYIPSGEAENDLPPLKSGVLHPGMFFRDAPLPVNRIRQLNVLYAKDYSVWNDAELVTLNLKKLDHHGTD
jgi:FlaA1/EpsC-like NDP-sugar epimerase